MSATSLIKQRVHKAIVFSLFSLSTSTIVSPALAASIDLNSWDKSGDVTTAPDQAALTNAFSDGADDASNYNVSGNDPTYINSLETFLGLNSGDLGLDATEGSAIKKSFNVLAGDIISFDYSYSTYDTVYNDRAFVMINNSVTPLAEDSSFSYTFATSGTYNIGIGVVDVNDTFGSSQLSVSNANYQPVPEPSAIFGSILACGFGVLFKRKYVKKLSKDTSH